MGNLEKRSFYTRLTAGTVWHSRSWGEVWAASERSKGGRRGEDGEKEIFQGHSLCYLFLFYSPSLPPLQQTPSRSLEPRIPFVFS